MMRIIILSLLMLFSTHVYAETTYLTAETLTIKDVEPHFKTFNFWESRKILNLRVIGIHQNGNSATAYIVVKTEYEKGDRVGKISFIRFNSGKWFDPVNNVLLIGK